MASRSATAGRWPQRSSGPDSQPEVESQDVQRDSETLARQICLRLLERRARSRSELEQALRTKGVPETAAARVLDRFTEVGLIDDVALAAALAQASHRERGLARRGVSDKLRRRGFDDEVIAGAVLDIDPEAEARQARELVTRRLRSLQRFPPDVQARRLVSLLARKGYPVGAAYAIVRDVLREHGASEPVLDDAAGRNDTL